MAEIDAGLAATRANAKELERSLAELERVGERFAAKMIDAFAAVAIRGKSLDGVFRSLALSLSDMALDAALKPFEAALGNLFASGAGGFAAPSGLGGLVSGLASAAAPGLVPGPAANPVNVTFNVATPDVNGFRQSQGQIAAMMSRTVGSGQRNL
jgi:phage-related minor tail protein